MYHVLPLLITGIILFVASVTDIKTREVPDWLNYASIISGLALSLLYSIIMHDFWPFAFSVAGFLVFLVIATIMFYAGQWGGGDSKLLIALGSLLGLQFSLSAPFVILEQPLISFWMNLLVAGVAYAFIWSIALALKNRIRFARQFAQSAAHLSSFKFTIGALFIVSLLLIIFTSDEGLKFAIGGFLLVAVLSVALWIFSKAVEKSCMLKYIEPEKLTEGDWIAKDIFIGKKYICGPKDLGIEKKQIRQLIQFKKQNKVKKVLIKEGIPFVPAFLIAFILTLQFGNILLTAIGW